MATINGIGTRLVGCSKQQADQSFTAYWCVTFLYFPVWPIRKIHFKRTLQRDHQNTMFWDFEDLGRMKMNGIELLRIYFRFVLIYPILIFWPFPFVVAEMYTYLNLPQEYYNWAIGFAIVWLAAIVWILSNKYDRTGLPDDWQEQMETK
jgi:hypothetical protein